MSKRPQRKTQLPAAARVFARLDADEALLPSRPSPGRRGGALLLALMILAAVPLYLAANGAGVIGDAPAAVAKSPNSGPGADDDDGSAGPGDGDDEADDRTFLKTDDTSANNRSTRGTTRDHDTQTNTRGGTNDTSRNGHSTRGTTNDNDTQTDSNTHTRTRGQTQTRTRTGG